MAFTITFDHVGLSVPADDLEATIAWYGDVFGFAVSARFELNGLTFAFLTQGDTTIELMGGATTRQAGTTDVLASMDPARLHHLCLAVDDLDAALADLARRGIDLVGGPMDVEPMGRRAAFITDNLGTIIELSESTAGS